MFWVLACDKAEENESWLGKLDENAHLCQEKEHTLTDMAEVTIASTRNAHVD